MKQPGTKVDFAEPHRKEQESTPLPQIYHIIGSETLKAAMKEGGSISTRVPRESKLHTSVAPDAMTWGNTWEMMNKTLEAFAREKRNQAIEKAAIRQRPSRNQKCFEMICMGATISGLR